MSTLEGSGFGMQRVCVRAAGRFMVGSQSGRAAQVVSRMVFRSFASPRAAWCPHVADPVHAAAHLFASSTVWPAYACMSIDESSDFVHSLFDCSAAF